MGDRVRTGDIHALQRRVARILELVRRKRLPAVRLSFWLFASQKALGARRAPDGELSPEDWEGLERQGAEGGMVWQIASLEIVAQTEQRVSAFSGMKRPVAMTVNVDGPEAGTVAEGLAAEASAVPSGDRFSIRVSLAYTKVTGMDEIATSKGTLRLPRLAEARFEETRTVPAGRPVVLGTLGPLPREAGLPSEITVAVRVSRVD